MAGSEQRIFKGEFFRDVARATGLSAVEVEKVYDAAVAEILEAVSRGTAVVFPGLGRFYLQRHKGHTVQYGAQDQRIPDYSVLKFSATTTLNAKLDEKVRRNEES